MAPQFDNIKVEVALNTEALESGKTELNELHKQKQLLEIDVQAMLSMVTTHTHTGIMYMCNKVKCITRKYHRPHRGEELH